MATKNKNVLPYILLPISMLLAGLSKVTIGFISDIIILIEGYFSNTYFLDSVADVVSVIIIFVVLVLFSLCCKGFTKKLQFIASACVGSLVYVFTNDIKSLFYLVIYDFDYDVAVIVSYIVSALVSCGCFVLSVVIAEFFFKKLRSYQEAPVIEGRKSFSIKKMIIPSVLILGVAVLKQGFAIFYDLVIVSSPGRHLMSQYDYMMALSIFGEEIVMWNIVNCIWEFGVHILLAGILIGSIFVVKDKYRAITCVASACVGYTFTLWGVTALLHMNTYIIYALDVVIAVISAIIGIVFYVLLNRKQMVKIEE